MKGRLKASARSPQHAPPARIEYAWQAGDTDTVAVYNVQVRVLTGGKLQEHSRATGHGSFTIQAELGGAE